jgi:ParB-like chromosome segregation protein Spo0J
VKSIEALPLKEKILALNRARTALHAISPFHEPVDLVQWIQADSVEANDYNPNTVAPPEMKLLELSIRADGYTQPIVAYHDPENERYVVVDGFHRNRVGKESSEIRERIHGYLPLTIIDKSLAERISSTIRHNRARGTHGIAPMSKIVENCGATRYGEGRGPEAKTVHRSWRALQGP